MASSTQSSNHGLRSAVGVSAPSNSFLLDKTKMNVRRSTPDSEALASSDDDQDSRLNMSGSRPLEGVHVSSKPSKPTRRPSWLNEVHSTTQRKSSFTNPTTQSSTNTTAADMAGWNATNTATQSRGASAVPPFNWGTGIWSSESRKEPPSRLSEVLPSPTSIVPPAPYNDQDVVSPTARETPGESIIPFAIPLHPTPKSYRSQSYSVGQLDQDSPHIAQSGNATNTYFNTARVRANPGGLQHRPSRPSMLSEVSNDGSSLGRLAEIEDDDDISTNDSNPSSGVRIPVTIDSRMIEDLQSENARLRAENAQHRVRNVPSSASINTNGSSHRAGELRRGRSENERASDYAIDEADDVQELQGLSRLQIADRRFSEFPADRDHRFGSLGSPINNQIESIKRGQWQSSHAFGGSEDVSTGRRRSFAESGGRHHSSSSTGSNPVIKGMNSSASIGSSIDPLAKAAYNEANIPRPQVDEPINYFRGHHHVNRGYDPAYQGLTGAQIPQHPPAWKQFYYVVTFKCERAEIYYVSEGMGLDIRKGSMVMVEADRGHDLGTVAEANIPFEQAKHWKDVYAKKHYEFMTMFMQNFTVDHSPGADQEFTSSTGGKGQTPGAQAGLQEQKSTEIKPKMIKRLAHDHEISALREKEGNEAKAKRVCQQRVTELRYNMEILDAEFQFDWRKLTFYFYANVYVNFNVLVTELFKVYKTRIWLEAVNPASLPGPNLQVAPGLSYMGSGESSTLDTPTSTPAGSSMHFGATPSEMDLYSKSRAHAGLAMNSGQSSIPSFGQQLQQSDLAGNTFQATTLGPLTSNPSSFVPIGRQTGMAPSVFTPGGYGSPQFQAQPSHVQLPNMFGASGQPHSGYRQQGPEYDYGRAEKPSTIGLGLPSSLNTSFPGQMDQGQQPVRNQFDQTGYQGQTATSPYNIATAIGKRGLPFNQGLQTHNQNTFRPGGNRFGNEDYQSTPLGTH